MQHIDPPSKCAVRGHCTRQTSLAWWRAAQQLGVFSSQSWDRTGAGCHDGKRSGCVTGAEKWSMTFENTFPPTILRDLRTRAHPRICILQILKRATTDFWSRPPVALSSDAPVSDFPLLLGPEPNKQQETVGLSHCRNPLLETSLWKEEKIRIWVLDRVLLIHTR